MTTEELNLWGDSLLLSVNSITGWVIPNEEFTFKLLKENFKKKLVESFATVNADEFQYAFRNFGTEIKDWGKQMNLSLIDEVMLPYLAARYELSKIEEQKKEVPAIAHKEDTSDTAMLEWLEETRKKKLPVDILPLMLYEWCESTGRIYKNPKQKYEYLNRAIQHRQAQLVKQVEEDARMLPILKEFNHMKNIEVFSGPEVDHLKCLAKRIILSDYIFAT